MLIILDHSGSNAENYLMASNGSGAPALVNGGIVISQQYATDPTGHTRYGDVTTSGTLLNYLNNLPPNDPADPSLYFALIDFNSTATSYPSGNSGFTSDIASFFNYVLSDAGGTYPNNNPPNDTGDTSYLAALGSAYSIISADIQNTTRCAALAPNSASPGSWCPNPGEQTASYYTLIFMSDGSPITNIGGVGTDANGNIVVTGPITLTEEPSSQILGEVQAIMSLAANTKYVAAMNLFTIYYYYPGNVDENGQTLLADMATAGNGLAYNALSGSNIDYNAFIASSKSVKYSLSDIFVTNSSVVIAPDGTAHLDSDRDGLSDDFENQWGSNPLQADTFGIGVSDLVLFQINGAQSSTPPAPVNLTTGACQGLVSAPVSGRPGAVTYPSSDPSGLNNCEKMALNDAGGIGNPDSNGDLITDWLELKNGVAFQLGSAPPINSPGLDGLSIYEKIKTSLPAITPIYQLFNPQASQYNLNLISSTDTQDCYQLNLTNLPTVGTQNMVRVDVILKSELLQTQKLYRVGLKSFPLDSNSLQIGDWNNPAEVSAGTWRSWP